MTSPYAQRPSTYHFVSYPAAVRALNSIWIHVRAGVDAIHDATGAWAGASGAFELNVAIPVMCTALLESIRLIANASRVLADKTIDGLVANIERAAAFAGMSPSIVTPLNKLIGYELGLSESTIGSHLSQVMRKLGAPSRVELIQLVTQLAGKR